MNKNNNKHFFDMEIKNDQLLEKISSIVEELKTPSINPAAETPSLDDIRETLEEIRSFFMKLEDHAERLENSYINIITGTELAPVARNLHSAMDLLKAETISTDEKEKIRKLVVDSRSLTLKLMTESTY